MLRWKGSHSLDYDRVSPAQHQSETRHQTNLAHNTTKVSIIQTGLTKQQTITVLENLAHYTTKVSYKTGSPHDKHQRYRANRAHQIKIS